MADLLDDADGLLLGRECGKRPFVHPVPPRQLRSTIRTVRCWNRARNNPPFVQLMRHRQLWAQIQISVVSVGV